MWSSSPPAPLPPAAVGPSNVWFTRPTLLSAEHRPKPVPALFAYGADGPSRLGGLLVLLVFLLRGVRIGIRTVRLQGLELDDLAGRVGDLRVLDEMRQCLTADDLRDQA